jgi:hypothetical protein
LTEPDHSAVAEPTVSAAVLPEQSDATPSEHGTEVQPPPRKPKRSSI